MKARFLAIFILVFAMIQNVSAQVLINVGTVANDGTGDKLRLAMGKVNTNFTTAFLNTFTVSNLVGVVSGNLTTVSNNVTSVSANVSAAAANLTTVSNRLTTDIANLTTVSNNVTSVSANVSAAAANLTTVSNSVGVVSGNLTTVSNSLTTTSGYAAPLNPALSVAGGLLQHNGTAWVTLPRGTSGYILESSATTNLWVVKYVPFEMKFSATSDATVGNSIVETTILSSGKGSKTLSAGSQNVVGHTLRVRVRGMVSNFVGSPTLTIRFKISGVTYATGALAMVNATNNDFECEVLMTTRSTGTGAAVAIVGSFSHGMTAGAAGRMSIVFPGTQVVDLTTAKTIDVTAQWGAANADNTITSQVATIEGLN